MTTPQPSPLTAEEEAEYREAWTHVAGMQVNEIGTLVQRLFATLDAARAASPDGGLRAALDWLRRAIDGRCSNPRCPSEHEGDAPDCVEFHLAAVEALASPAPAGLDDLRAAVGAWTPQHSSACAAQDDDDDCICGTSAVYHAALTLIVAEYDRAAARPAEEEQS